MIFFTCLEEISWSKWPNAWEIDFHTIFIDYHTTISTPQVERIRKHLKTIAKPGGLYPNFLNPNTGNWGTKHISLGALGDSFYEYLLKSWLMTSKDDVEAKDMYYEAIEAIDHNLVKRTDGGMMYITDVKNGKSDGKMQHLVRGREGEALCVNC